MPRIVPSFRSRAVTSTQSAPIATRLEEFIVAPSPVAMANYGLRRQQQQPPAAANRPGCADTEPACLYPMSIV